MAEKYLVFVITYQGILAKHSAVRGGLTFDEAVKKAQELTAGKRDVVASVLVDDNNYRVVSTKIGEIISENLDIDSAILCAERTGGEICF